VEREKDEEKERERVKRIDFHLAFQLSSPTSST